MNVAGWEDPNLKPTLGKVIRHVRDNYIRNPYTHRMFDTRAKGMIQNVAMAEFLQQKEQASLYKRKYNGDFYFSDFFSSNKWRLLLLNFGEFFGIKQNLLSHELRSFSKNFFKGPFAGYLLNAGAYTGIYGHAAYRAGKTDEKFITFMITTVFSAIALSPVQYLAHRSWYGYNTHTEYVKEIMLRNGVPGYRKPLFVRSSIILYQRFFSYLPASVIFSSLFGLSMYLHNCNNPLYNLLYYPSLVLSYISLSFCGNLIKILESETDFLKLRYYNVVKKSTINYYGLGLFFALNALCPIEIDQLKGKNEFKYAYLDFVNNNEAFKGSETIYA